jgi:hypothetical protein
MTGAAGIYQLDFLSSGVPVGSGQIRWDGSAEILFPVATEIAEAVWRYIRSGSQPAFDDSLSFDDENNSYLIGAI